MALFKQTGLFIDGLRMTRPVTPVEHSFMFGQLKYLHEKEAKKDTGLGGWTLLKKEDYLTHLLFFATKHRMIASLTVGMVKGYRFYSMAIHPSKLRGHELCTFREVTDSLLLDLGYSACFAHSRVSYLELGVDQLSVKAHTFIPYRPYSKESNVIDDGGTKGTTYLGSKTSPFRLRIYDKHRQLVAKGIKPIYATQTRIEVIMRNLKLPASELVSKLPNPLSRVKIADLQAAHQQTANEPLSAFLVACLDEGSASALSKLSPHERRAARKLFVSCAASWWDQDFIWTGFPKAMDAISPLAPSTSVWPPVNQDNLEP